MSLLEHAQPGPLGLVRRDRLAKEMGVSARTIIRFEEEGMPVVRVRRLRLYDLDKIRAWLTSHASPAAPASPKRRAASAR